MNRRARRSRFSLRWKRILFVTLAIVLIAEGLVSFFSSSEETVAKEELVAPPMSAGADYFESRRNWLLNHEKETKCFAKGATFYDILKECGLSTQAILRLDRACKPIFDLSRMRVDQILDIWFNRKSKAIEKISLHVSSDKVLHINRIGQDFFPSLLPLAGVTIPAVISGTVSNSFYQAAFERGMPAEGIMEVADIFAWDIDFLADIRNGDRFQVILDTYYRNGDLVGHGNVVACRFVNQNKTHESFYFTDSKGESSYYDRNGRSLRKAFLKSPLRYRRISSYFSLRRLHPILKIYRPHYGVDYAAPRGTPVESIGSGRITFIGWKGGYGRYIKIRHNHIYETGYGHLSRFAKGLTKGSRVRQGEVIGYVGSSGLATGPHLDFSMIERGRFVNPLKVVPPPSAILNNTDRERFNKIVCRMEELWQEN